MDVGRHVAERLEAQQRVLACLDGAHLKHESLRQAVEPAHLGLEGGVYGAGKGLVAALVDDAHLVGLHAVEADHVALGALADGYYQVGLVAGVPELVVVDVTVNEVIVSGQMTEDDVVDGDDAAHSLQPADAHGQFAAEAVEDADAVAQEVGTDGARAPERAEASPQCGARPLQADAAAVALQHGVDAGVGADARRIDHVAVVGIVLREAVDDKAAVVAEACHVAHRSFPVESYFHFRWLCIPAGHRVRPDGKFILICPVCQNAGRAIGTGIVGTHGQPLRRAPEALPAAPGAACGPAMKHRVHIM